MLKIAIIAHSAYGHTYEIAKHIEKGIKDAGAEAKHFTAAEAVENIDQLEEFDGLVFGSPTYMGSASAEFKKFMDTSSKVWMKQKWRNKIAAGFTNSGAMSGDKLCTLTQFAIFAAQHGMIWVGNDIMPGNNSSAGSEEDLNRIGSWLGLMTQANVDEGPETAPPASDRKTAEHFGTRIAELTKKFVS